MHIDQFPEDIQKAVYAICATAIKRAIKNGAFEDTEKNVENEKDNFKKENDEL